MSYLNQLSILILELLNVYKVQLNMYICNLVFIVQLKIWDPALVSVATALDFLHLCLMFCASVLILF